MITPAQRNFQRKMAAKEASKAAETGNRHDLNLYELMQAQLFEHRQQLKNIQSLETKAQKKAEFIPVYEPYIEGVLAADEGLQDDVLMTLLIWHIDAGLIVRALDIAAYAIKHGLTPPDQFQRTTATIIAEDIAEVALKTELPLELLQQMAELVLNQDMPDQVKGKVYKVLGLHPRLQQDEPKTALNHLQSADGKLKKSGVKTAIKNLQKQLAETEKEQEPK